MPDVLYGEVFYILDIGISLDQRLSVFELVTVLRDGLVLVTSDLPDALADLLPPTTTPVRCEVHLLAPRSDGQGQSREDGIGQRIDLDVFSTNSADHVDPAQVSWGFGAEISSALAKSDAGELIQAGVNYLALTAGFLDPRRAVTQIRGVLGLAAR